MATPEEIIEKYNLKKIGESEHPDISETFKKKEFDVVIVSNNGEKTVLGESRLRELEKMNQSPVKPTSKLEFYNYPKS